MISALAGLLLAATPAASASTPDWAHPRTLPSLVRQWQFDMVPCGIGLHDGTVYAFDATRLVALDARTGVRRWEAVTPIQCLGGNEALAVTGESVAVGSGERLLIFDRRSGALRHAPALGGSVERVIPSPLVAVVRRVPDAHDLVAVDTRSGTVTAEARLRGLVYGGAGVGSHVMLKMFDPDRVIGVRATDMSEVWSKGGFRGVERIDGRIHLLGPRFEAMALIDAHTGAVGPARPEPKREDCRTSEGGVDLPWDVREAPHGGDNWCEAVRRYDARTGQALWKADLPSRAESSARAGDMFFVHVRASRLFASSPWHGWTPPPSRERGRGFLVGIDWTTGRIRHIAFGLRSVRWMRAFGDRLVLAGNDGMVGVSARRFGPPECSAAPARKRRPSNSTSWWP